MKKLKCMLAIIVGLFGIVLPGRMAAGSNPSVVTLAIGINSMSEHDVPVNPGLAVGFRHRPIVILNGSPMPVNGGMTLQTGSEIIQIKCTAIDKKVLPIPAGGCGNRDYIPTSCSFEITRSANNDKNPPSPTSVTTPFKPKWTVPAEVEPDYARTVTYVSKQPYIVLGFPWLHPENMCAHSADYVVVSPYGPAYFSVKAVESGKPLQATIGKLIVKLQREGSMLRIIVPPTSGDNVRILQWIPGGGPSEVYETSEKLGEAGCIC